MSDVVFTVAEKFSEALIGIQKLETIFIYLEFGYKARKVIVSDGLFLLNANQIVDIGHYSIGNRIAVYIFFCEHIGYIDPDMASAFSRHSGNQSVTILMIFERFCNLETSSFHSF